MSPTHAIVTLRSLRSGGGVVAGSVVAVAVGAAVAGSVAVR